MRIFSNDVMEVLINKGLREFRSDGCFDYNEALAAKKSHESLEAYQKTPLVHLDGLAKNYKFPISWLKMNRNDSVLMHLKV